jgi:hypothetical protein
MDIDKGSPKESVVQRSCKDVLPYFQHTGTCWFNAILMATLFSQAFRNILQTNIFFHNKKMPPINENGEFEFTSKEHFAYLIHYIMSYKYYKAKQSKKDIKFHNYFKPEKILDILLKVYPEIQPITSFEKGYNPSHFVIPFCNILNISTVMFFINSKNEVFFDMKNDVNWHNPSKSTIYSKSKLHSYLQTNNPDVIIVSKNDSMEDSYMNYYKVLEMEYGYNHKIDIDENNKDLLTYNDTISYNNTIYKLDSIILSDFKKYKHAIAGITCKNERFVYNGWTKNTVDPSLKDRSDNKYPCDLFEYNWDPKIDYQFCINNQECTLPNAHEYKGKHKSLCFSFNKGVRLLIYVRQDKISSTSSVHKYKSFDDSKSYTSSQYYSPEINNCDTKSFLTSERKDKCIAYDKIINDVEKIDKCFSKNDRKLQIDLDKYILSVENIINTENDNNIHYKSVLTEKESNQNIFVTVQINETNMLDKHLKKLSDKVIHGKTPHFLLYYTSYHCDNEQIFKLMQKYKYKNMSNYNVYLLENFDEIFNNNVTLFLHNLNDDFVKNIITQIVICIHLFHIYTNTTFNSDYKKVYPTLVYQYIKHDLDNQYICYHFDGNKYFLKTYNYLFQIYLNKDLYVYDHTNVELKKLNFTADYFILNDLIKYTDVDIQKLLEDIYYTVLTTSSTNNTLFQTFIQNNEFKIMKTLIENNYLSFVTELPENSIVLNEDNPYEL